MIQFFDTKIYTKNSLEVSKWSVNSRKFGLFLWYFFPLKNHMCSNELLDRISWKIWSVLMTFLHPGKSYVFLWNFKKALLEILMCTFSFSWKIYVFLYHFLVLLENFMSSYKRSMSSPIKSTCFLLHPSLLENSMCSRIFF